MLSRCLCIQEQRVGLAVWRGLLLQLKASREHDLGLRLHFRCLCLRCLVGISAVLLACSAIEHHRIAVDGWVRDLGAYFREKVVGLLVEHRVRVRHRLCLVFEYLVVLYYLTVRRLRFLTITSLWSELVLAVSVQLLELVLQGRC